MRNFQKISEVWLTLLLVFSTFQLVGYNIEIIGNNCNQIIMSFDHCYKLFSLFIIILNGPCRIETGMIKQIKQKRERRK